VPEADEDAFTQSRDRNLAEFCRLWIGRVVAPGDSVSKLLLVRCRLCGTIYGRTRRSRASPTKTCAPLKIEADGPAMSTRVPIHRRQNSAKFGRAIGEGVLVGFGPRARPSHLTRNVDPSAYPCPCVTHPQLYRRAPARSPTLVDVVTK